ncbi:hypothetical protein AAVH_14322 [Aphelenchoides avenae]|nr:hypothetical protein AAVH_14322 [Aphelenchus avenae]
MVILTLNLDLYTFPDQFKYCVAFEILGAVLTLLVLVLSVVNIGGTFNFGPRIFVVNMMLFNLLHTVCTMVVDISFIDPEIRTMLGRLYIPISNNAFLVQTWVMLVFNATLVPMMAVSLVVSHRPDLLDGRTSLSFALLILVADGIPTAFQAVNVWRTGNILIGRVPYMCASYALYVTQMCLTVVALYWLFRKSSSNVQSSTGGSRKIVYRFLLFSIGPCLIQLPFALQMITRVVRDGFRVVHGHRSKTLLAGEVRLRPQTGRRRIVHAAVPR